MAKLTAKQIETEVYIRLKEFNKMNEKATAKGLQKWFDEMTENALSRHISKMPGGKSR